MHVLYYHQHFSTPEGALGTRSYAMARHLIERGHQVTMVCGRYSGGNTGLKATFQNSMRHGIVDGINVIEFDLPYSNNDSFFKRTITFIKFSLRSIKIALQTDYDLLFATSTPLTVGIPGIFAKLLRRKPFVFEVRDLWPELPREMGVITNPVILKMMSILEWSTYHAADACIGLSPGIVAGIKKRGIDDSLITMIPNGCDLDLFARQDIEAWRPDGVLESDLLAVFTGTHGIANGIDAALDAAQVLKERGRDDIKLCFIGQGKLKAELLERAKRDKLSNCIFLDLMPKRELAHYLKGADVGMQLLANVAAFYYGTSPNKFFDYIASGLPVLNNYPGWLADLIEEFGCGKAVPPENPIAFANALEQMADQRDDLMMMGNRAIKLAEDQFDREKLADNFVRFLEKQINFSSGGSL
jgi:glycosyltransferase involved in cell wall biosynthesis